MQVSGLHRVFFCEGFILGFVFRVSFLSSLGLRRVEYASASPQTRCQKPLPALLYRVQRIPSEVGRTRVSIRECAIVRYEDPREEGFGCRVSGPQRIRSRSPKP